MKDISIENVSIEEIKPYENNPRNNDDAVDAVATSIKEFGFKVPIVIDVNNVIVTGHTRYKAAKQLGFEKVPCIKADDLTDQQIKAFRLADNKVGEIATWDMERLNIELGDIDIDMSEFGFDDMDIEDDVFEPINDEGHEKTEQYDHKLKIDNITLILTDEEVELFKDKLNKYVDENGVTFGFIKSVLGD